MSLVIISKRLALKNTNTNCFAAFNNEVVALNFKSVFPVKTRFVPDKWHSALHECLVQMTLGETISLYIHKISTNSFNEI